MKPKQAIISFTLSNLYRQSKVANILLLVESSHLNQDFSVILYTILSSLPPHHPNTGQLMQYIWHINTVSPFTQWKIIFESRWHHMEKWMKVDFLLSFEDLYDFVMLHGWIGSLILIHFHHNSRQFYVKRDLQIFYNNVFGFSVRILW